MAVMIDTYKLVRVLQAKKGFTRAQSVAITRTLLEQVEQQLHLADEKLLKRHDAEQEQFAYKVSLHNLKTGTMLP